MIAGITYQAKKPDASLAHCIESFWLLANTTDEEKTVSIMPDGRIDLFFSKTATSPFHVVLLGLESGTSNAIIAPQTLTFAVSFKLLAAEYVLKHSVASLLDGGMRLPDDFWGMSVADLDDFEACCNRVSEKIKILLNKEPDPRKLALFNLIYNNNGDLLVHEMASKVHWTSRQINRYFNQWFGLSLKAYCNILRFRASFAQIKAGKFFPEQNFADQAHFIRTVKKYAGVAPKALNKNKNDRFIQFSTLPKK
ncbi:helix-turn-helix domain-containing protein [Pedobacter sp. KR3-3]|uniref:Helix-turn-helix domain-containing protein n=1 Tax=Pedobacter albus TaxID=3113905 RepID=A0ABU7I4F8_9SPHI|nr:helix-turn-helix domain-containing protein [Pedobacter sp. KR3-3]MEE1944216.1 helix-turn-helix domain-containing protein [Pedobacter sp. KR3-3]